MVIWYHAVPSGGLRGACMPGRGRQGVRGGHGVWHSFVYEGPNFGNASWTQVFLAARLLIGEVNSLKREKARHSEGWSLFLTGLFQFVKHLHQGHCRHPVRRSEWRLVPPFFKKMPTLPLNCPRMLLGSGMFSPWWLEDVPGSREPGLSLLRYIQAMPSLSLRFVILKCG